MKKGQKRKQKKTLKRRSERVSSAPRMGMSSPREVLAHVRQANSYPIEGCWIMPGWEEGGMAVVVVARRQTNGNIVYGVYLVDYYCLGLKNTFYNADIPAGRFRREILPEVMQGNEPQEISPALAHEIIYGAIEFAQQYGFRPQRDYRWSRYILDPPDMHPRTGTIAFGYEGKPFFISGPYDNADAVLRQLGRTAGEGNYEYLVGLDVPSPGEWEDDDDWEDDDE